MGINWNEGEGATGCVRAYHEAEAEADDDGVGDGDGGELEVAEVAGEGLRDDVHAVGDDAAEDGRRHDVPQLPRLLPHPRRELLLLLLIIAALGAADHHLPLLLLHAGVQQRHPARRLLLVGSLRRAGHRCRRRVRWSCGTSTKGAPCCLIGFPGPAAGGPSISRALPLSANLSGGDADLGMQMF